MITAKTYRSGLMTGKFGSIKPELITQNAALLRRIELGKRKLRRLRSRPTVLDYIQNGGKVEDLLDR